MVLVKCLQMPRGQGSTVAQVFNYQFQGMLRYIRQHSSTRTCYSTATAPSCQQEDVLAQERFEIAEKRHLGEYYNDWLNLYMVRSRLPSGLCPPALLLLYTYKKKSVYFAHEAEVLRFHFKSNQKNLPTPQQPSALAQTENQTASFPLRMARSLWPGRSTYCNVSVGTENGIDRIGNLETQNGLE